MKRIFQLLVILFIVSCEQEHPLYYVCEKFELKEDYFYTPNDNGGYDTTFLDSTWVSLGFNDFDELPNETRIIKYKCIKVY